ncbi:MAG: DUF4347 domain-containing protein [Magnetococcus sp. MYC-9]
MMLDGVGLLPPRWEESSFDGDPDSHEPHADTPPDPDSSLPLVEAVQGYRLPEASPRHAILFVDGRVSNHQNLLAGASPHLTVVVLAPDRDGVEQIAAALAQQAAPLDSIHILSHGDTAQVALGNSRLSSDTLERYAQTLSQWGRALTPNGDILLYGCEVGAGDKGAAFVSRLSQLTGADVAASQDPTGAAERGGNWVLERASGPVEATAPFAAAALATYGDTLAVTAINLSSLSGSDGFKLAGSTPPPGDLAGFSVRAAGDVNGDGYADVVVGAPNANGGAGYAYVVFGQSSAFTAATITLSNLNGSNGFRLTGAAGDFAGYSVSSAGDINGDGFDDLVVGAYAAGNNSASTSGSSYVVFGQSSFSSNLSLASLNGASTGFRIDGESTGDLSGASVGGAGDVNGDGYDDLTIGAIFANGGTGSSYVMFGKSSGFSSVTLLSSLNSDSTGFRMDGSNSGDYVGASVSGAGDINGDGFADLLVGTYRTGVGGNSSSNGSFVVFGKASGFATVTLDSLTGSDGFIMTGAAADGTGRSVSAAGDVNGDGYADLIVGAYKADPASGGADAGSSYVVWGQSSFSASITLSTLASTAGVRLDGVGAGDESGRAVGSAGDVNGDGYADLIIGARKADPASGGTDSGSTYVVLGSSSFGASALNLSALGSGYRLHGVTSNDHSGFAIGSAGDVDGDGFDDLIVGAAAVDNMISRTGNDTGAGYLLFSTATAGTGVTLTGTAAANSLVGGSGADTLTGGGGKDVLHGGSGNDTLAVSDLTFQLVDGGLGRDTLSLSGSGLSLTLASERGMIQSIESINITGTGNNTLTLTQRDLLNLSESSNTLVVYRDTGDTVSMDSGWTGSTANAGYYTYTQGQATLKVATAPVFTSATTASVAENAATSTIVYTAVASDTDITSGSGDSLTYTLGGTDASSFSIGSGGAVTLQSSANYEAKSSYSISVTATDSTGLTTSQTVTVGITDVNEAPTFGASSTSISVAENTTAVYTAAATDVDSGSTITYSLGGTNAASFSINSSTGVVTLASAANYESTTNYSITVTATDNGSTPLTATQTVTVAVTNVNEAPVFSSGSTASIAENSSTSTTVYTAAASDVDSGDTLTYSLGGTDAASFSINSASGAVTLNSSANYETTTSYSITVTVTDSGGLTASQGVTVSVTNVNEAPTFSSGSTASIAENSSTSTVIYTAAASDVDSGDSVTYSLSGTDAASFSINSSSGAVTLNSSPNYESTSSYSISVVATDSGGLASSQGVTVGVTNVNEAPTFSSGSTASIAENSSTSTVVYTGVAVDVDSGDTLTYSLGGTDAVSFSINNSSGVVTLNSSPNYESTSSYSITLTATDGSGLTATQSVTVSVTDVNESPTGSVTLSGTATQGETLTVSNSLADDDGLGTISYQWLADGVAISGATGSSHLLLEAQVGTIITVTASYTDAHGTAESVTSSASSTVANVNDSPTGNIVISGTATQGETLSIVNTLADDDGLGSFSYQWLADGGAVAGATGSTLVLAEAQVDSRITVTVQYTDGHGTAESITSAATNTVANVNDAPTGSVVISGTATQGETLTVSHSLADIDGLGSITYRWLADGVTVAGATGSSFILTESQVGHTLTVTARYTDGHGTAESVTSAATGAVANVNDLPTGDVTVSGTATQGETLTVSNTLADLDGLGSITYQWLAAGAPISGATGSSYRLTEAEVDTSISVTASYHDGHGTVESIRSASTPTVANVNDAPTGSVTLSGTATQGELLTAVSTLADLDGLGRFTYLWQANGTDISGATDSSYRLTEAEVDKTLTVTILYSDGHGTLEHASSPATRTVLNVNDAPTGEVLLVGTATQGEILTVTQTLADIDGLGTLHYQWLANNSVIVGATGSQLLLTESLVDKVLTVVAGYTDGHGTQESLSSPATRAVLNVNDPPTGRVTIHGTAMQEQTLTVSDTLADIDGLGSLLYQWLAAGISIDGATDSSYRLTEAEVGKSMAVIVRYTDGHGTVESITTPTTSVVQSSFVPSSGNTAGSAPSLATDTGAGGAGVQGASGGGTALSSGSTTPVGPVAATAQLLTETPQPPSDPTADPGEAIGQPSNSSSPPNGPLPSSSPAPTGTEQAVTPGGTAAVDGGIQGGGAGTANSPAAAGGTAGTGTGSHPAGEPAATQGSGADTGSGGGSTTDFLTDFNADHDSDFFTARRSSDSEELMSNSARVEGLTGSDRGGGRAVVVEGLADTGGYEEGVTVEGFRGNTEATRPMAVEGFGDVGARAGNPAVVPGFGDAGMPGRRREEEEEDLLLDQEPATEQAGTESQAAESVDEDLIEEAGDSTPPAPQPPASPPGKPAFTAQLRPFGAQGFHQASMALLKQMVENRVR